MTFDMKRVVIELEYRGIVAVENAMAARIDCLRGRIWITERGCMEDVVLEAGQSYEISRGGVVVVQALREAIVALRSQTASTARAGPAARVERLLGRWAARAIAHPAIAPASAKNP